MQTLNVNWTFLRVFLNFHTADCSPAEVYMTQNYVLYVLFCYDTHDGADGDLVLFTLTDFMYLTP